MEKKSWAIVDDDAIYQLTTRLMIERHKADGRIMEFYNGRDAIHYLLDHKGRGSELPDIILLDLYMPIMDGWDFLEKYLPIRNEFAKNILLYIVSSSIDQNDIRRAEEISAVKKYYIKPINRDKLHEIMVDFQTFD